MHFNRVFHYKPSIPGYPYFWKHPYFLCFFDQFTTTHTVKLGLAKGCFKPESSPFSSLVYGFKEYCPMGHDIQETPQQSLFCTSGCMVIEHHHTDSIFWGGTKMTNHYVSADWKSQQVRNTVPSSNTNNMLQTYLLEWIISDQCYVNKQIKSNQSWIINPSMTSKAKLIGWQWLKIIRLAPYASWIQGTGWDQGCLQDLVIANRACANTSMRLSGR